MIAVFNAFIKSVANIVLTLMNLLPLSPFQWLTSDLQPYLAAINYFIPFSTMLAEMEVYVPAVLIWYGVRWILKFVHYAD